MRVVNRHTADDVWSLTRSGAAERGRSLKKDRGDKTLKKKEVWSPGGGAFPVSVILRVAVDGDDADGRTGRVRDDDGLRLVTSKGAVEHRGGMNRSHGPGGAHALVILGQ